MGLLTTSPTNSWFFPGNRNMYAASVVKEMKKGGNNSKGNGY